MQETSENLSKIPTASVVDTESSRRSAGKNIVPPNREKFIQQAIKDYESPLIGYASTILNDIDRARDVVQDTFTRLCQQDLAKVSEGIKSWLFTVCRNRALDVLRKDRRNEPLEDIRWKKVAGPGLQPDEEADQQERSGQLMGYLHRLTNNQREVIILKFQQGLSYKEIQTVTGLTSGNIGFLIHTGLKRLRDIIPDDIRS